MKYADGPTARSEVTVARPPARVWRLVSDITVPTRFSPELRSVEWLDGATGPVAGARFAGHNENRILGRWRTVAQVIECEPERVFAWSVLEAETRRRRFQGSLAEPVATWRFGMEPAGDGTRLSLDARLGPGPSALSYAIQKYPEQEEKFIADRVAELTRGIERTLAGVTMLAEDEPA